MKDYLAGYTDRGSVEIDRDRVLINKSIPGRLGLIAAGLLVFQTGFSIWLQTESFWSPATMVFNAAAWILGISCFVLAMLTDTPRRAEWLILAALVGALWGSAYVDRMNYSPSTVSHTDNEMIGEYSAEALRYGYNPYTWNFSDATRVFRDAGLRVTTYLDGSTQNRVTYPALPTLLLVAFGEVGLGQARTISLIFHTALLILIFVGTPGRLRSFIALPLFASRDYIAYTLSGLQDVVWSTLLVAMVLFWKRPALRAILFGLACAYRQQPWILAPFLIIYLWHETAGDNVVNASGSSSIIHNNHRRLRAISYFVSVSLGVFLLVNLPFMLWGFRDWTLGVFEPIYAAFNVYSQSLGALSQYNLLPYTRAFYTSLQLSALAIMLVVHWRHSPRVAQAFWVFPGIFFWLYYRGLGNYWLYWIPPLLVAVARHHWHAPSIPEDLPRWRWTAAFLAAVVAANLLWGVVLLRRPPAISASLSYPIESFNERDVTRLGLIVTNSSAEVLRPRFSVQLTSNQPLPWNIELGPEQLESGQVGHYIIHTISNTRTFSAARGAQVVVTDAGSDYGLRAVIDVPGDPTFASPDQIINPSFVFWSPAWGSPAGWSWYASDQEAAVPHLDSIDGHMALVFPDQNGIGFLSQTVTFPDSFSIWVRPVAVPPDLIDEVYGLQLDEGNHRLRVLFGDRQGSEQLEENIAVVYMRAPLDQWSRQTIDPPELYARFGWELPPYSIRSRQGLEFAARQISLRLIVSGMHVSHAFGPIEQDPSFGSGRALVEEAIAHPDDYYVNMGDEYCRQRNLDLARQAFLRALDYNPDNASARQRMGSCP